MSLMLLDSASLWYRAFYGMPDSLLSPDGTPVNAIRGYLDMSARLITTYQPNRLVACIEGDWRPSWRVELFPDYKANRIDEEGEEEEPDLLAPQIPILMDILDAFGIAIVGVDDYEADDVMASFAERELGPIRIVTGDRDMFQVVDDSKDVKVVYLAKGISQHDLVDLDWIQKKYQIPGDRYALFAMFRGDPSDGLPGVKGIGEKGAALICNFFPNVDEVILAAKGNHPDLTPNLIKKILDGQDYLAIAPTLVQCARNVSLPQLDLALPKKPEDLSEIYSLQKQYGLGASIDRMIAALRW
ncbi:MAG: flap endonuclease [Actinobacteria bacterium]|nr:flap endonuclease [Actinomycetota bacterium]MSX19588.1 flap endonuclease [Actinomycetota bacterium]MSY93717.1 flap endonuclease [Actinomycetota bacterium]